MTGIAIARPSSGGARKFAAALIVTVGLVLAVAFAGLVASNKVGWASNPQAPAALNAEGYNAQRDGERALGEPNGYEAQRAGERTIGEAAGTTSTGDHSRLVMRPQ
jgi:hypothetical protein